MRVQLSRSHRFQFAGFYAAVEQGYYAAEGLEVHLLEGRADEKPEDAVVEGRADYGVSGAELVLSRCEGYPVVALACIFQHSPVEIFTRDDCESVHDLAGLRVALGEYAGQALSYLQQEGLDREDIVIMDVASAPESLAAGVVSAVTGYSTEMPYLLQKEGVRSKRYSPRSGGVDFYGDVLFTSERELRENPARVQAVRRATLRGWHYAMQRPHEVIDLILAAYAGDRSREQLEFEARATRRLIRSDVVEPGHMNPGRWRHIAQTYASLGMMPRGFDVTGFLYQPVQDRNGGASWAWLLTSCGAMVLMGGVIWRYRVVGRRLRQEAQEERAAREQLARSEERYRKLVDRAPYPVLLVNQGDDTIHYVNPRARHVFHADGQELTGRKVRNYFAHTTDRLRLGDLLDEAEFVSDFDTPMRREDGTQFWATLKANYVRLEDQDVLYLAIHDISGRKNMEDELREAADYDSLTGLPNRRHFHQTLEREKERAERYGHTACLMVMDLDRFKQINDEFGHQAGDEYLKKFADVCEGLLRRSDTMGRVGGEEFAVLLPETELEQAREIAERIRRKVAELVICKGDHEVRTTASIGLVAVERGQSMEAALAQADRAMYEAKAAGRDKVRTA